MSTTAVAVVDARTRDDGAHARSRATLIEALRGEDGLVPLEEPDLVAALAGDDDTLDGPLADAALRETRDRFGDLDCAGVREPGQRAVQYLAGREAAGQDERVRLRAALSYLLLCADRDGARGPAQGFASHLRTLGGSSAIPADVWARYPELDAVDDLALTELAIPGLAGAAVWLDHRRIGTAPLTVKVADGTHVLAMARGVERAGMVLRTEKSGTVTIAIGLTSYANPAAPLAAQVRRWQAGAAVGEDDVARMLEQLTVRFAIVLDGATRATVWARPADAGGAAVRVGEGDLERPEDLAGLIRDYLVRDARTGPDPSRPLITEADLLDADLARTTRGDKRPTAWWVYAAIGGAAIAGAVTIYALDAGENRQRIELTFP